MSKLLTVTLKFMFPSDYKSSPPTATLKDGSKTEIAWCRNCLKKPPERLEFVWFDRHSVYCYECLRFEMEVSK